MGKKTQTDKQKQNLQKADAWLADALAWYKATGAAIRYAEKVKTMEKDAATEFLARERGRAGAHVIVTNRRMATRFLEKGSPLQEEFAETD